MFFVLTVLCIIGLFLSLFIFCGVELISMIRIYINKDSKSPQSEHIVRTIKSSGKISETFTTKFSSKEVEYFIIIFVAVALINIIIPISGITFSDSGKVIFHIIFIILLIPIIKFIESVIEGYKND